MTTIFNLDEISTCAEGSPLYEEMRMRMKMDGRYKYKSRGIPQTRETLEKNRHLAAASIKTEIRPNLKYDSDGFSDGL